jgi:hypothetical protein
MGGSSQVAAGRLPRFEMDCGECPRSQNSLFGWLVRNPTLRCSWNQSRPWGWLAHCSRWQLRRCLSTPSGLMPGGKNAPAGWWRKSTAATDTAGLRSRTGPLENGDYSTFAPLSLMGLAHFSISLTTNFARYSGVRFSGGTMLAPRSARRLATASSFKVSTTDACSLD